MNFIPSALRLFASFRSPPILSRFFIRLQFILSVLGLVCRLSLARIVSNTHTRCRNRQSIRIGFSAGQNDNNNNGIGETENHKAEAGVCVCFETIYFIQNLFVIRVDLCARAGSTVHSPRSVKRNFHLSLLYCYLDGRQEIVLLVLGSFSPRTRMCAPSTRGQSVRVFVQSYTRCKHKFSTQYGK